MKHNEGTILKHPESSCGRTANIKRTRSAFRKLSSKKLMYPLGIEELDSFCCCKVCVCQKLVESHKIGHDSFQCEEFS